MNKLVLVFFAIWVESFVISDYLFCQPSILHLDNTGMRYALWKVNGRSNVC